MDSETRLRKSRPPPASVTDREVCTTCFQIRHAAYEMVGPAVCPGETSLRRDACNGRKQWER
jgi:hypothetical protein